MSVMPSERPRFIRDLDTLIRARYPLLYLVSWEEQRVDALLAELARSHGKDLLEWTATRGLRALTGALKVSPEETLEPARALTAIAKLNTPALVILKDFH